MYIHLGHGGDPTVPQIPGRNRSPQISPSKGVILAFFAAILPKMPVLHPPKNGVFGKVSKMGPKKVSKNDPKNDPKMTPKMTPKSDQNLVTKKVVKKHTKLTKIKFIKFIKVIKVVKICVAMKFINL